MYSDAIHKIYILVRDEQTPVEKYEFYIMKEVVGIVFANDWVRLRLVVNSNIV